MTNLKKAILTFRSGTHSFFAKINAQPLTYILLLLLLFFLPFQHRYHKPLKHIYRESFAHLTTIPFNFDRSLYFYITDFFMLAIVFKMFYFKELEFKKIFFNKTSRYLTIFVFLSFLSVVTCNSHDQFWVYFRWMQLFLCILFFYGLSYSLDLKELLPKAYGILFAVAFLECIIVCFQYFLQSTLGLKSLGEGAVNSSCTAFFSMPDKSKWLLDTFFHTASSVTKILRAPGTFPHPNILGGFMGFSLFSSYYLFTYVEKRLLKTFIGCGILLQLFVLCITFSRAAIFGSVICTGIWFCLCFIKRKSICFSKVKSLAIILLSAVSLCFLLLYPQFLHRGGVINYNTFAAKSDTDRVIYQKIALNMIKSHPFQGVGFNHFHLKMNEMNSTGNAPLISQTVHNIYLLIAAEMGLVALLMFLAFLFSLIYTTFVKGLTTASITLLCTLFFLLWLGLCDHYLLTNQHGRIMLFATLALLINCPSSNHSLPILRDCL